MKNLAMIAAAVFTSCASLLPAPVPPKVCQAPPDEYMNGRLVQCKKNKDFFACALEFTTPQGQLCAYIVAQPSNDCTADWVFTGVVCADPPIQQPIKKSSYDAQLDEGWEIQI